MEANKTITIPIIRSHKWSVRKCFSSNLGEKHHTISHLTSVFFALFSPNIVVIVATIWSSGHNGGCVALKALHGQFPLARCHIYSGKVRGAKLHPSNKVSCSILCTETQMQAYHGAIIVTTRHDHANDGTKLLRGHLKRRLMLD